MVEMKNKKIKSSSKKKPKKSSSRTICLKKTKWYQNIIQDTILYVQKYKTLDIIDAGELNICIQSLEKLYDQTKNIITILSNKKSLIDFNDVLNKLQTINNDLSVNFRLYGTKHIDDVLNVCFGNEYINDNINDNNRDLFEVIKKYTHPINYKILDWKDKNDKKKTTKKKLAKNRIIEDFMLVETAVSLDCFDLARTTKNFQTKVYGIKVCFQNPQKRKTMIVSAITDDMVINCMNLNYLSNKLFLLNKNKPTDPDFLTNDFCRFCNSLTLKELLVYSCQELYQRYMGYINQTNLIKKKTISQIVKEFISNDLFAQRKTLIQLLMKNKDPEFQYLAYLLYDLLSNESNGTFDTIEQTVLFDSLPWTIKKYFRDAMKTTIKYTKNLSNFDTNKIPIEQQICLLKASDSVKEKAMLKLKEVKAKSEDSGSKARQYLDGLLKIPFGIFKKEKILSIMDGINDDFKNIVKEVKQTDSELDIPDKNKYSSIEIEKYSNYLKSDYSVSTQKKAIINLVKKLTAGKRDMLISNICFINSIVKKHNLKKLKILHSGKKNEYMRKHIVSFLEKIHEYPVLIEEMTKRYPEYFTVSHSLDLNKQITDIEEKWETVNNNMDDIRKILDKSIYGHTRAKRQIERVIGQWITGKQSGYCFGFEGPPGVGKTSLARNGLAYCLKDADKTTRPFSFIALGGSSNGSTLSGHNYTYVGSTWGRIVDILMESKCMNPIIFIDELDKVSKTENGKEIIGILTHLIDPTQNESFQDKYFSGIDLDLSNALFIFSYNDVSSIDRILLDRIHRIKFDNLTLYDKLEITNNYILPELYEKVGLIDVIHFNDDVLKFIIEKYTYESGVRKLKELLFEVVSEINLEILNHKQDKNQKLPIEITIDDIKYKYLKEKTETRHKKIHTEPQVGIINGLWANSLGMGGIIPIECFFLPSNNFMDLKLTGLQGDVMKESMNVAKTLAWKLTKKTKQTQLCKHFEKTKLQGIHIHCPEGATPKDGPSAGTAITSTIYSLLNDKKIKKDIAITGEINLQGKVSAIGGLELKILGGLKAGVKTFIYPTENEKDYKKFVEKYKDKKVYDDSINFISVSSINQVLDIIFV